MGTRVIAVCLVCTVHEEAEAIIHEFSRRCHVSFARAFYGLDRYEYRYTTIHNRRKEPLRDMARILLKMLLDCKELRLYHATAPFS
jgi:hypothetical protein